MEQDNTAKKQQTSGIKRTWGIIISLFVLVIIGLATYYSYLILGFSDNDKYFPLVATGLFLMALIVCFVTLYMTWNKWVAFAVALLLLLAPIAWAFWVSDYCSNCPKQLDLMYDFINMTSFKK